VWSGLNWFRTVSDDGFTEHDSKLSGCTKAKEDPDSVYNTRVPRYDYNAHVKMFNMRNVAVKSNYLRCITLMCA
jgi:hypothetical protein